jgi:transcriptional regulator with XRE-family HTH domain
MSQSDTNMNNPEKKSHFLQYIGEEMYSLRKSQQKSLKTVAKATKMSSGIVSRVEKGLYENLGVERFLQLCKYYNEHVRDVLDRVEQRQRNDAI